MYRDEREKVSSYGKKLEFKVSSKFTQTELNTSGQVIWITQTSHNTTLDFLSENTLVINTCMYLHSLNSEVLWFLQWTVRLCELYLRNYLSSREKTHELLQLQIHHWRTHMNLSWQVKTRLFYHSLLMFFLFVFYIDHKQ